MVFRNVNTYHNMVRDGQARLYDLRYEGEIEIMTKDLALGPKQYPLVIDGQRITGRSHFDDRSPIDENIIVGRFPRGSAEDVDAAVDAAKRAFSDWSRADLETRLGIFTKAADIMDEERFRLAAAITYDNGKNRHEAIAEVDEAIDFVRYYVGCMKENNGFSNETPRAYEDERSQSVLRPYGVWAVICPFNFPLAISCGMMTGAMVTGNTVVVKPASPAPLMPYLYYDILERAGLPPGVMNVVTGGGAEVGGRLTAHPEISGFVFTGSKEVGFDLIKRSLRRYPVPVIAEMGGKNPAVVMPSADLEKAVRGIAHSAFSYSGQKCSACSRAYVHEEIFDDLVGRLVRRTESLRFGDPRKADTYSGPVIHAKAVQDYERYVEMARKDGKVHCGGKKIEVPGLKGYYVAPTIVTGLHEDHFLLKNELFLPILCVQRVRSLEEALRKANDVDFGLTAGIYSTERSEIEYFFDNIEAGVCYANRARGATTGAMVGSQPFCGWKASGSTGKGTGTALYLTQFMRQHARTIQ
ncbi:MAG: aldehyde dehydrogenase family protein [Methanomassiliicoccales archaeon]|nr:MAG: aldehyde dehydrogenase family protein [Methanomassiliicoccales archaeon]